MTKRIFANRARKLAASARDNPTQIGVEKKSGRVASSTTKATELATHIHCSVFYNLG